MSISFPPGAINGQVYQGWVFDGEKWNPNWASKFVTSVNNKSGALMPADVVGPANRVLLMNKTVLTSAPAASVDLIYDFSVTTYDQYELDIYDYQPAVLAANCYLQVSFDGATFQSDASYHYVSIYAQAGQAVTGTGSVTGVGIYLGAGAAAASQLTETRVKFSMPWATDRYKIFMVDHVTAMTGVARFTGAGGYLGSGGIQPLKGLRVKFDSGNVARAAVNLYGLVKPPIGGT
jgi:hypothetical protein